MNMLSPPRARVTVEIVLDLVCPWCFLGIRRLMRSLRSRPEVAFDISWHPFLLNPDMPHQGMGRGDYLLRKFGPGDRADKLQHTLEALGRAEGIDFRFDLITRAPSSIDAHRLVSLAGRYGLAHAAVDALFAAHFCLGQDIGDTLTLMRLAADLGIPGAPVRALLANDEGADQIHAENLRAHRMGVNGVPCFVLNGRHAIAGAQEANVFERLIDVALAEERV
jgi:predicted DsbA family dithiol-disulfide isomerase